MRPTFRQRPAKRSRPGRRAVLLVAAAAALLCAPVANATDGGVAPPLAADTPDGGQAIAPAVSENELRQLREAPVIALVKQRGRGIADCTSIGWYHVTVDVLTARPGRRLRTAHYSVGLGTVLPEAGSLFVAGLKPTPWRPTKYQCLPAKMGTDAQVELLVAVKDEAEGRALIARLRRDTMH